MKTDNRLLIIFALLLVSVAAKASDFGKAVTWYRHSLLIDGHRVCPVMGEIHYSRVPAAEWLAEVRKMREGGVTIIATYIFWNHIEEQEGIYQWDGQRNLKFRWICKSDRRRLHFTFLNSFFKSPSLISWLM